MIIFIVGIVLVAIFVPVIFVSVPIVFSVVSISVSVFGVVLVVVSSLSGMTTVAVAVAVLSFSLLFLVLPIQHDDHISAYLIPRQVKMVISSILMA